MKCSSFHAKLALLSAVLISESLLATVLMPFAGLYVAHLSKVDINDSGYLSGILVAVFQLGQVLTGKMWGAASDRVGRKPMIQIGLIANAITATFFGMSPNLGFCIFLRFFHGCANGNVLVAKTVIADITDASTESAGFAAISIFWGVGSIIGPTLGGILYDPFKNEPIRMMFGFTESSIFSIHPALLPCVLMAGFFLLTLVLISVLLPETSKHHVDPLYSLCCREQVDLDGSFNDMSELEKLELGADSGEEETHEPGPYRNHRNARGCLDDSIGAVDSDVRRRRVRRGGSSASVDEVCADSPRHTREPSFGYSEAFQLSSSRTVLLMYMCIAAAECALLEVIPLWAIASTPKGGLEFNASQVGWLLGASAVICVIANVLFSKVMRCLDGKSRFIWDFSVVFWACTSIATPLCSFAPPDTVFWWAALLTSCREVGLSWSYSLIYMYVVRSAPPQHTGAMNGIAQSIGSLSRTFTMAIIPPIFAWSLNGASHSFPWNYNFAFWLTTIPLFASFFFSSYLPTRVVG